MSFSNIIFWCEIWKYYKWNTNDIIDRNIGIVDVIIEPTRGMHKVINRMQITKTGGIQAGAFSVFV